MRRRLLLIFLLPFSLLAQTYTINTLGSVSTCTGNFYDDGGPSGNYSSNKTYVKTFCSSDPAKCIRFTFSSMNLVFGAQLFVYDGSDTTASVITVMTGSALSTVSASTLSGGCLTFKFVSTASAFTGSGWAASISCVTCNPPPPASTQDCVGAIPVCQNIYTQNTSYVGNGSMNEITVGKTCLAGVEVNSVWYKFTIQSPGDLSFLIKPQQTSEDYDWALFNLTGKTCKDLNTSVASCNSSGNPTGNTGMSTVNGGVNNSEGPSFGSPPSVINTFNKNLTVTVGQTYYLLIENWTGASSKGYTLDFTGSTASIFDQIKPTIKSIGSLSCGTNKLTIVFSEDILCSTVANSDFTLTGPGGPYTISQTQTTACLKGLPYAPAVLFDITPTVSTSGTYKLCLTNASGSVSDICGNIADVTCFDLPITCANLPSVSLKDTIICLNKCASLNAVVQGGSAPYTYLWSPSIGNGAGPFSVCPSSTASYTVTVTDTNGKTATSISTITVRSLPTIIAVGATICNGSCAIISASGSSIYSWNSGLTGSTQNVCPAVTTNYTVTGTDNNSCTATAVTTVILSPPLSGELSKGTANCTGCGCKQWVMVTATGGASPYTYLWPDGYVNRYKNQLCPGNYTINIKDKNGCSVNVNLITP